MLSLKLNLFPSPISRWIDNVISNSLATEPHWIIRAIYARAVACTIFPLSLINNIVYLGFLLVKSFIKKMCGLQKTPTNYKEIFYHLGATIIGFIAFPLGLIAPDIVSYHFLEVQTNRASTDFGKLDHIHGKHVFPKSIQEVIDILQDAHNNHKTVAVSGNQFSQGGQTLPQEDGIFLHMSSFKEITLSPDKNVATVGAGVTWEELQKAIDPFKKAVQVMQASNIFTVGGSLAANVHGWDHRHGSLAETVESITFIDGKGVLHKDITRNSPLFKLMLGGYGTLGVIVEAKIKLAKNHVLKKKGKILSLEEYIQTFANTIKNNKEIKLHYGRIALGPNENFDKILMVNYYKTNKPVNILQSLPKETNSPFERICLHILRRLPFLKKIKQWYDNRKYTKKEILTRNQAMQPKIKYITPHASNHDLDLLQEYFIPKNHLKKFLSDLNVLVKNNNLNIINATIRYVKKDFISIMPYANEDCFSIVLYLNSKRDADTLQKVKKV
ncbi:MAG TPA: FAD-binding oxidoreductase, partial [Gammaproteobacteria bacterium]|nr:FAD-binding oxidoreductase [Gammaproteobacteria bacterium]